MHPITPNSFQTNTINPANSIGQNFNAVSKSEPISTIGPGQTGRAIPQTASKTNTQMNNMLVPADERLSKLEGLFDDKTLKQAGAVECVTCSTRTYQDGSNDPGVSFKAPTQLNPSEAASAVPAHEAEHVVNEKANAESEGREVISQSVQIFTSICPECGKTYVSGGLTKTTTGAKSEDNYNPQEMAGNLLDMQV